MIFRRLSLPICFALLALAGCDDAEEPARVELSVVVDSSGIATVETNLGYQVGLSEARVVVENLVFTIAGEAHTASLWGTISDRMIPEAHAHPGHFQDGDVTGELRGRFVVSWLPADSELLGRATLLVGSYKSANFTFALARSDDGLSSDDPLLGHTAILRGQATKAGHTVDFVAIIDSPVGRQLVGAVFELEVTETTQESLGFRLLPEDPLEGDTLFDDLDFTALDSDGDGQLSIDPASTDEAVIEAYNQLRRTFQTHDHYDVRAVAPNG